MTRLKYRTFWPQTFYCRKFWPFSSHYLPLDHFILLIQICLLATFCDFIAVEISTCMCDLFDRYFLSTINSCGHVEGVNYCNHNVHSGGRLLALYTHYLARNGGIFLF